MRLEDIIEFRDFIEWLFVDAPIEEAIAFYIVVVLLLLPILVLLICIAATS